MKKFIEEFKAFALRGNVMDMAIGVIIGGAFTSIVTSLTENIINPILGAAGSTDLSAFVLNIGGVELRYGAFITSIINFLIMAFVLFCLLKAVNKLTALGKKPEAPAEPEKPKNSMGGLLIFLVVGLLGGGAALYYVKFMKPKQSVKGGTDLDEFDFDEYDEDEPEEEADSADTEQEDEEA